MGEQTYLATYRDQPFFMMIHAVARLQLLFLLGATSEALQIAPQARALAPHLAGTMWPIVRRHKQHLN